MQTITAHVGKGKMMRLIDAEPILMRWNTEALGRREMYEIVKNASVIDIVLCKDCKFSNWYTGGDGRPYNYCTELERGGFEEADYCSFAERKDDE